MEVEIYNCGCKVRRYEVEYGESQEDLTEKPTLVSDFSPCQKHKNIRDTPPEEARLLKLRGEHEAYLNE